jgi:RNA polymerase sigma-70 factor (ECF subfamily)
MTIKDVDVSGLLHAWQRGDRDALETLVPLIDHEMRWIARQRLEWAHLERALSTASLVQEAYVQLIGSMRASDETKAHFLAHCSKIMRDVVVDYARARLAAKRGGFSPEVPLDEAHATSVERSCELLAIDGALDKLCAIDPRKAKVIEMRFFCGMTAEETAEALRISVETVARDWRLARIWLRRELLGSSTHAG